MKRQTQGPNIGWQLILTDTNVIQTGFNGGLEYIFKIQLFKVKVQLRRILGYYVKREP